MLCPAPKTTIKTQSGCFLFFQNIDPNRICSVLFFLALEYSEPFFSVENSVSYDSNVRPASMMFALFCASRNALTIEPRRVSLLSNRMRANSCSAAFSVSGLWISGLLVSYTISLLSTLKYDLPTTMFALFCASPNRSSDDYMGAFFFSNISCEAAMLCASLGF